MVDTTMMWEGCNAVEVVPGVVSGVPIVRGSRVQADTVLESHQLGKSVEEIVYSFDLDPKKIREVLSFATNRFELKPTAREWNITERGGRCRVQRISYW